MSIEQKTRRSNGVFSRKKTVDKRRWIHHSCQTIIWVDGLCYKIIQEIVSSDSKCLSCNGEKVIETS